MLWPAERDPAPDVAIVQISSAILRRLGHAAVGARIAASPALRGRPVRLLLAGTATGHDAVADYEELMRHAPGVDVAILEGRRPLDVVDQIRRARVVVGTSLHVRIIAAAYGVPRVSLVALEADAVRARVGPRHAVRRRAAATSTPRSSRRRRPGGGPRCRRGRRRSRPRRTRTSRTSHGGCSRMAAADTPADRAARADARRAHALAPGRSASGRRIRRMLRVVRGRTLLELDVG